MEPGIAEKDIAIYQDENTFTSPDRNNVDLSPQQKRRLRWKVDLRVLPMLGIIYGISVIDRNNIGQAKVLGLAKDLELSIGARYSVVLLVFFPAYTIADLPSNLIISRVTPKYYLPFLMFAWSAILTGMAFLDNWRGLAVLRFLLGIFEGGVLPGLVFLISTWYPNRQLSTRITFAYGAGILASALSGLFSYALGKMDGMRGMHGWRWIFSIEGGVSMFIALIAPLFLPSMPEKAKWLTPEEATYLRNRITADRGDFEVEHVTKQNFIKVCKDWTVWFQCVTYCFNVSTAYANAFFIPSILVGMGYTGLQAVLYSAYPYFATMGMMAIVSYLSDKFQQRGLIIMFNCIMQLAGFVIMRPGYSTGVRYLGIFLATMSTQCNSPGMLAFSQANVVGSAGRAVSSALLISAGGIGGIIGSTIFRAQDAPAYVPGIMATVAFAAFNFLATAFLVLYYMRANKNAAERGIVIAGKEGFRYSL